MAVAVPFSLFMMLSRFLSSRVCLLVAVAAGLALSGCVLVRRLQPARQAPAGPPLRDVVYGHAGARALTLDMYLPTDSENGQKRPVVVFLHGGGWKVGDKSEVEDYVDLYTSAGYAVASVNYRLSGVARFPAQIFDAKTAVRWVRANAGKYGLDPHQIGVLGLSAGGHLAALLGTSEGVKTLEDRSEGSPDESSRVQAVVDVSGPIDLTIPTHSLVGKISVDGLFGGTAQQKPELARMANPALYTTSDDAPTLLIYGDKDDLVLPVNATLLADALHKVGVPAEILTVHGGKHVPFFDPQQQAALDFFGSHLGRN